MNIPIGYFAISLSILPIKNSSMYTCIYLIVCYKYIKGYNFVGDLLPKMEIPHVYFLSISSGALFDSVSF